MVRRRLAKWSKWKTAIWLPLAAASALFTPNQTIKMIANERNIRFPMLSKRSACSVISCVRNAKISLKVLGGIGTSLWHAPGAHGFTGACGLRRHDGFTFGHKE